jgi:hypothetical protein
MKLLLKTTITVLTLGLTVLTGCASSGSMPTSELAKQNRWDIKYEVRDRNIADSQLDRSIERNRTRAANLESYVTSLATRAMVQEQELKQLRETLKALCAKRPEDCKSE